MIFLYFFVLKFLQYLISLSSTLDYIFMSKEWVVHSANVIPNIIALASADESEDAASVTVLDNDKKIEIINSISTKNYVTNDQSDDETQLKENNEKSLMLNVSGPQPSEVWPSDHFMIVVKASF